MMNNTRALRNLQRLQDARPLPIGRASRAAIQLQQDIADARKLWRKIVFVPDAPVVRLAPDDLMAVTDSRNVTVIPAVVA